MIHHVALEVRAGDLARCVAFWGLLGWQEVPVAPGIDRSGSWLQCDRQQLHLQVREQPVIPADGHVALVDAEIDATAERLAAAGHELLERTPYWGARRVFTRCPAGHRVELMADPPR